MFRFCSLALFLSFAPPSPRVLTLPATLFTGETSAKPLPATMPGGFAIFDYDNDGRLDLFFPNGAPLPAAKKTLLTHSHRLFRNLGGLRFADVTAAAGLAGAGYAFGVTAGDYNSDGCTDLLLNQLHSLVLYRNLCNGSFRDETASAGINNRGRWAVASAWFDFDNDGDLDLFTGNYVTYSASAERPCLVDGQPDFCHPRHYPPTPNAFFRNTGQGRFVDESELVGIEAHPGKAMSLAVADFNNDGFTDVFVTNDRLFNFLFLNQSGKRFEEQAFPWGVAVPADGNPPSAMGADAQDFNHDSLPDLVYTALRDETFPLYRGTGKAFLDFSLPSRLSRITRPMSGWGIQFADLDNDSYPDLIAARSDALSASGPRGAAAKEPPAWFRQQPDGTFALSPAWQQLPPAMYRGILSADLDGDGCLEVVLTALQSAPRILSQPCPAAHHWLAVAVSTPGARIRAGKQWRTVSAATGYASSYSGPQHFGLGTATTVDVEVFYPDGRRLKFPNTPADRVLRP